MLGISLLRPIQRDPLYAPFVGRQDYLFSTGIRPPYGRCDGSIQSLANAAAYPAKRHFLVLQRPRIQQTMQKLGQI